MGRIRMKGSAVSFDLSFNLGFRLRQDGGNLVFHVRRQSEPLSLTSEQTTTEFPCRAKARFARIERAALKRSFILRYKWLKDLAVGGGLLLIGSPHRRTPGLRRHYRKLRKL
jgi:hypothetical protein